MSQLTSEANIKYEISNIHLNICPLFKRTMCKHLQAYFVKSTNITGDITLSLYFAVKRDTFLLALATGQGCAGTHVMRSHTPRTCDIFDAKLGT